MAERILLGVIIVFVIAIGLFVRKRKGSPSDIATQSVAVMILSVLLLPNESLKVTTIFGGALILIAVIILTRAELAHEPG